jgi:hypothetical protein
VLPLTAISALFSEVGNNRLLVLLGPSIPELVSISWILKGVLPSTGEDIIGDSY